MDTPTGHNDCGLTIAWILTIRHNSHERLKNGKPGPGTDILPMNVTIFGPGM